MDHFTNDLNSISSVMLTFSMIATAMSNIIITGLNIIITDGNFEANVAKIMRRSC